MQHRVHRMPFGAELLCGGGTRFRLWAPSVERVELHLPDASTSSRRSMRPGAEGWHELIVPDAGPGSRYQFLIPRRGPRSQGVHCLAVPDPASRSNPSGVHEASIVIDPHSYAWREASWRGRPWEEAVVYELHVGTFTEEGSFAAVRPRLAELASLGVTALELMPVAAFAGERNWGYDGVLPFAPAACYGSSDELKALIDAAHSLGLMMLLDVVYNHFGPEGNYLHAYCTEFFDSERHTPWGVAINLDGEWSRTVRDFFVHNALYWVEEYCFDGLRLDAVHALHDTTSPDLVSEIATALHEGPGALRHVHLVLENDRNDAHYLARDPRGQPIRATAQWNDDVHHALHVLISGENDGHYADYAAAPLAALGRSLAQGFAYQGEFSPFRAKPRGEASGHLPPSACIAFLQNHDVIGNRAFGDRVQAIADERTLTAAYALLLLTPQVPMLFMGEEFAASTPFLFFCDFRPELAGAVARGRLQEFKRFAGFADEAAVARIPDLNDPATFAASKLRWQERERSPHRRRLALVRELLALRRSRLGPHLPHIAQGGGFRIEGPLLHLEWTLGEAGRWLVLAHFGASEIATQLRTTGEVVFGCGVHRSGGSGAVEARLDPGAVLVMHARSDDLERGRRPSR